MIRKTSILVLSLVLAVLVGAFILAPPQIVEINEAQIEQGLEENLPYRVDRGAVLVTVQDATVQLSDEGKIVLNAQFDAAGLTLEGIGSATITSAIRYDDGKFYLSDLKHENIDFQFSENSSDTISDVKSALEGILRRETDEATAGEDDERVDQLAKANEYYEKRLKTDAIDALDKFLGSFPVYNLNQAGGRMRIAALALDDVEITSEKVLVSLSLQTLIIRLTAIVGTFLLFAILFFGQFFVGLRRQS